MLVLVLTLFVWFFVYKESAHETQDIKVGALLSLTGKISTLGEDVKNGIEVFRIINRENENVSVIYEDSKGDPKGAILGAQHLIDFASVDLIMAGPGSSANSALAPELDQKKIPFIAVTSHLDTSGKYIIKAHPDIEPEIIKISSRIRNEISGKVGVIYDSASEAQVGAAKVFKDMFLEKGRAVTLEGVAINSTNDYRGSLVKFNNGYDAIFILPNEKNAGVIVKQIRQLGFDKKIYGWSVVQGDEFFKAAGDFADGIIITDHPFYCESTAESREYCEQYKKHFKSSPLIYGAYAYDVMNILQSISPKKGQEDVSKEDIIDAFTEKTYSGISGTLNFDEWGNIKESEFVFKKSIGGKFVEIE